MIGEHSPDLFDPQMVGWFPKEVCLFPASDTDHKILQHKSLDLKEIKFDWPPERLTCGQMLRSL